MGGTHLAQQMALNLVRKVYDWKVGAPHVKVRKGPCADPPIKEFLPRGTTFRGTHNGAWVRLVDGRGYVRKCHAKTAETFLERQALAPDVNVNDTVAARKNGTQAIGTACDAEQEPAVVPEPEAFAVRAGDIVDTVGVVVVAVGEPCCSCHTQWTMVCAADSCSEDHLECVNDEAAKDAGGVEEDWMILSSDGEEF